jgi:hypothetical protein
MVIGLMSDVKVGILTPKVHDRNRLNGYIFADFRHLKSRLHKWIYRHTLKGF